MDQSGLELSSLVQVESNIILDQGQTNHDIFGTWTKLVRPALDQSTRVESARIRSEVLIYWVNK